MYLPKAFEETRLPVLHALIRSHPLGTWVSAGAAELDVQHIPFLLDSECGEFGTLYGHIARANPIWKSVGDAQPDVVIFRGPQTYITPSWYPSKHLHVKDVPTWNYAVVAAHGRPEFIHDPAWLHAHLRSLSDGQEAAQAVPWSIDDAPADYIDKLEKALVRIENKTYGICRVTGKLIDKARLRAVPHATLSIEAKMGMSRNPNIQ